MAGIVVDGSGLNVLAVDLRNAAARIGPRAQMVMRKTARDIEADAKAFCPVDTGNLKNSIGHSDLRTVGQSGVLEVEIGPTAFYGIFVEFGTSQHGPAAFMGPALNRRTPAFIEAMQQLADEVVP